MAALIPYHAAHRHRRPAVDHSIEKHGRLLMRFAYRAFLHGLVPFRRNFILGSSLQRRIAAIVSAARRPCVDVRSAPAGVYYADRNSAKRKVKLTGIVVRHSRERTALERRRLELLPAIVLRSRWRNRPCPGVLRKADVGQMIHGSHKRARTIAVAGAYAPDRALHVTLPRREPHFADKHITYLDAVGLVVKNDPLLALRHGHRAAFCTGRHGRQLDKPCSIRADIDRNLCIGKRNRHKQTRLSLAPHGNFNTALKHHAIRERRTHFYLGLSCCRDNTGQHCYCIQFILHVLLSPSLAFLIL